MGRGAIMAPISTLNVSRRRLGAFSQRPPPCMMAEIMLTGAENCMRSSIAASRKVCVPPPEAPVAPMRDGVDLGQRLQEIHHADGVPQLQAERAEVPELFRRGAEIVRRLDGVVVAHHVVAEDDVALLREVDAARRHGGEHGVLQAAVVPVAVRRDDRREAAGGRGLRAGDRDCRPDNSRAWSPAAPSRWSRSCSRCGRRSADAAAFFGGMGRRPAAERICLRRWARRACHSASVL